jgi:hypothetical protein
MLRNLREVRPEAKVCAPAGLGPAPRVFRVFWGKSFASPEYHKKAMASPDLQRWFTLNDLG